MRRQPGWLITQTGRPAMRSPGKPPIRREVERAFWGKIAEGLKSEDAATACGVSGAVGCRWFRERGGMPTIELSPPTGRCLSVAEREKSVATRPTIGSWTTSRIASPARSSRPTVRWSGRRQRRGKGRNRPRRQDRVWATAWNPE